MQMVIKVSKQLLADLEISDAVGMSSCHCFKSGLCVCFVCFVLLLLLFFLTHRGIKVFVQAVFHNHPEL